MFEDMCAADAGSNTNRDGLPVVKCGQATVAWERLKLPCQFRSQFLACLAGKLAKDDFVNTRYTGQR